MTNKLEKLSDQEILNEVERRNLQFDVVNLMEDWKIEEIARERDIIGGGNVSLYDADDRDIITEMKGRGYFVHESDFDWEEEIENLRYDFLEATIDHGMIDRKKLEQFFHNTIGK